MVYRDNSVSLFNLKESVESHVHSISQFTLLSAVEHAILRFRMVADNGGHHIEHVLKIFVDYFYLFNKPILSLMGVNFETHCLFLFDKNPTISVCHYRILVQFRCVAFVTEDS